VENEPINLDGLSEMLIDGEVKVVFTKKNGDERTMRCTLNYGKIMKNYPEFQPPTNESTPTPYLQKVWDLDKKGWRCFIKDSVISFE
jgi:hypothetical protein